MELTTPTLSRHIDSRAVYRNFAMGGRIWDMDKREGGAPGGSSVVSWEVLHSKGGGGRE